jgi:hypothetical protein
MFVRNKNKVIMLQNFTRGRIHTYSYMYNTEHRNPETSMRFQVV